MSGQGSAPDSARWHQHPETRLVMEKIKETVERYGTTMEPRREVHGYFWVDMSEWVR